MPRRDATSAHGNWTDPHNHYTFSGKEWDEHLDSYEFGYRQYDPRTGVWLTQDPLRGESSRPRTLHRYQYVFASPISYRDAYGLQGGGGGGFGTVTPEPVPVPVPTPPYIPTPTPTSPYIPPTPTPIPSGAPTPDGAQCDPTNWYAPLQPDKYTQLPRFLDWLAQPWLHIVPKAQFELGRDGVMRLRFSNMVSDMELELGIKNQVRTSTGSPWLVTTSGVRQYLPGGRAWIAAGNGEVSMGSQGAAVSASAGGLTVSTQAWTATSVNVSDRPGTLRYATMAEMPVSAELEGVGSVRKTLYFRMATNQYGDRALAETVGVGAAAAAWKLGPIAVVGGGPVLEYAR